MNIEVEKENTEREYVGLELEFVYLLSDDSSKKEAKRS